MHRFPGKVKCLCVLDKKILVRITWPQFNGWKYNLNTLKGQIIKHSSACTNLHIKILLKEEIKIWQKKLRTCLFNFHMAGENKNV